MARSYLLTQRFKCFAVCFSAVVGLLAGMADYIDFVGAAEVSIFPIMTVVNFTQYIFCHRCTTPFWLIQP